jgi:signal transduction histidine kinase/ligand-binding sensor domain-containing protein
VALPVDSRPSNDPGCLRRISQLSLAFFFILLCHALPAQTQYGDSVWTVDNGLPQNSIRGIVQDPLGYLWIPTFNGLARFDGAHFTLFNRSNTPGIASDRFSVIASGKDGDLWIVTDGGGLTRYHNQSFQTYGREHGILDGEARGITADDQHHVWILAGDSIEQWDEARQVFRPVAAQDRVIYNPFNWGSAGFWGRDAQSLHWFIAGRFYALPLPAQLRAATLPFAALDQDGTIWLETAKGEQFAFNGGRFTRVAHPFITVRGSRSGRRWKVGIGPRLTLRLDFVSAGRPVEISPTHFYEDQEQNLWVGTEGQGLYRLRAQLIRPYSKEQGLVDRDVFPIYQDRSDAVWIGAWHTGLSRFANDKFTNYTVRDGLPNGLATAIYEDSKGRLWVATHGGLSIFERGRFRKTTEPKLPDRAVVQAILEDRAGTIWFGTSRGLVSYRDGVSRLFTTRDGLATDNIVVLIESAQGDVWIGGYGGLARLHNGQFTKWTEAEGLPSSSVWSIYEDHEGTIWIGTYDGGLARLKDGAFHVYGERDGLFSDGVYQILEDAHGNLWISCSHGIYRVSESELNQVADGLRKKVTSVAYGKIDGMVDLESNGGIGSAGIKAHDGKMWFPTQDGVVVFDPNAATSDNQPPPVVIESGLLDRSPIPVTGTLRIPPGKTSLEIQYTALRFDKPEQVRFRYKMEGLDADWIDAGDRRTAYYSHLPPGDYVFRVIAANPDGVWNETGSSLPVVVLAPFYKTKTFFSLLALAAVALLVGFSRYRIRQHERAREVQQAFSQQLIASQETERKRIAAELHDSLGQRLVVINNLALFSLKQVKPGTEGDGWEQAAREISEEAMTAIGETRAISYNLRPFQLDRLGLRRAIAALIRTVENASGISITSQIADIDELFPEELRINVYRILQEALQNLVKHSEATEASVKIEHSQGKVILVIQDNGRGFAAAQSSVGSAVGSVQNGFGLTGMVERAALLGGTLKVHSELGHGTTVSMDIPVKGA